MSIQDNTFSLIAVRILPGCDEAYRKNLKVGRFYFFNDRYVDEGDRIVPNPKRCQMPGDFFGRNINVQAVCGVNGAGKSTLFEMVYRIINNLSCLLECDSYRGGAAARLWYIEGIQAKLYYELENELFTIGCFDDRMYFEGERVGRIDLAVGSKCKGRTYETVYRHLFYTLVTNYSMQSLVPLDYDEDKTVDWRGVESERNWLEGIYSKNDGYRVPLGMEPYKWYNRYDMERQADLVNARAALLLLGNNDLISGYQFEDIEIEFDEQFYAKKVEGFDFRNHVQNADFQALDPNDCLSIMFGKFEIDVAMVAQKDREVVVRAMAYIFDKIWSVANNYPSFEGYVHVSDVVPDTYIFVDPMQKGMFESLCESVYREPSHISTKIIQTINFIKAYVTHNVPARVCNLMGTFSYNSYFNSYSDGRGYRSLAEHELHFIPPYYKMTIWLRNSATNARIEYTRMSSGERQFVQQMGSCMYHMRNLMSVEEYEEQQGFERPKYHHFNLILDEIEICFHPEYQRTFLLKLIDTIEKLGINEHNHIYIILSSHSPFLLSDLPRGRVLLLKDGDVEDNVAFSNTFGANISTLLNEDFFLANGFIGGYAQKKITDVIAFLERPMSAGENPAERDRIWQLVSLIGDPLLHGTMVSLFYEHYSANKAERIQALEDELQRLKGLL